MTGVVFSSMLRGPDNLYGNGKAIQYSSTAFDKKYCTHSVLSLRLNIVGKLCSMLHLYAVTLKEAPLGVCRSAGTLRTCL